jgi:hypothetical protein
MPYSLYRFSNPSFVLRLYPTRFDQTQALKEGTIDLANLLRLCGEVNGASWHSQFRNWSSTSTFLPLVLERLLACTGDPTLRLGACWDRRPRDTLLDFGWTRENRDMPITWSFFAHCNPEHMLASLVEIMDTVAELERHFLKTYEYSDRQPWKFVTTGHVLRSLYRKRLLVQPQPQDKSKYAKHILYILVATELLNTYFKSEKTDPTKVEEILSDLEETEKRRGRERPLSDDGAAETILQIPLSDIATRILCPRSSLWPKRSHRNRRSGGPATVFDPKHLRLDLLVGVGALKVEWTEFMHEHLTFDSSTLTLYIYWFASHIEHNSMYQ